MVMLNRDTIKITGIQDLAKKMINTKILKLKIFLKDNIKHMIKQIKNKEMKYQKAIKFFQKVRLEFFIKKFK